jgi:phosphoribosyl-ATP pyrophosphohydrolase/phosphoribosyl-AMP cyclohydrolase
MDVKYGDDGLIPAIVQDRLTGQVRMVAYMTREALARTLATGRATFFSRSRGALWEKGEQSGNTLHVRAIYADCDADALVLLADPAGPSCHTGRPSCFFREVDERGQVAVQATDENGEAAPFLDELERIIASRRDASASKSYTRTLLDGGADRIGAKLREEADELACAIASEADERVVSEAADVLYHLMVGLASRGIGMREVIAALADRTKKSGHEEKAARGIPDRG